MATVLQTLARDLSNILAEHLIPAPRVRDRVTLALLMLFSGQSPRSQYYRWNLLFRDFAAPEPDQDIPLPDGRTASIPVEAVRYVDEVLWLRRLTLANNLKERPSNIHLLFERACQLHAEQPLWGEADLRRSREFESNAPFPALEKLAQTLDRLCLRLGDDYGDISRRRRAEFGPLWLLLRDARAEVPEELSLDNVVEASPLPLSPGFHQDKEFSKRLLRVIEALNERYMQLRACGLKPDVWLAQERPSINQLAELRALRLAVQRYEQQGMNVYPAFERAFGEGLAEGGGKKFGGFTSFEEFCEDAVGVEMMHRGALGILGTERSRQPEFALEEGDAEEQDLTFGGSDFAEEDNEEGDTEADGFYPEEVVEELDMQKTFYSLPDQFPEEFSPVMRHFFQQVLVHGRDPERKSAALQDPDFLAAVKQDARYRGLSKDGLLNLLFQDAEALIQQNVNKWRTCR